jgi:hypothetical protein
MYKPKWCYPSIISEILDINNNLLRVHRVNYKAEHGEEPCWAKYDSDGKLIFDLGYFEYQKNMRMKCKKALTHPEGLYYTLTELHNVTPSDMSRILTEKKIFKTKNAAYNYIYSNMWSLEDRATVHVYDYKESTICKVFQILKKIYHSKIFSNEKVMTWEEYEQYCKEKKGYK